MMENNSTNIKAKKKDNIVLVVIIVTIGMFLLAVGYLFLVNGIVYGFEKINFNNKIHTNKILLENVKISGYSCSGNDCSFGIVVDEEQEEIEDYSIVSNNIELFKELKNYNDDLKINIYYIIDNNQKKITDYEIYNINNNKKIENIKTEEELRSVLGYHNEGTYSEEFTLVKNDEIPGFGSDDKGTTYVFYDYIFLSDKNRKIKFRYIIKNNNSSILSNLEEGKKYIINFEVKKGAFEYEYSIISIQPKM